MSEQFDQAFWDERYRSQPSLWSGRPNVQLVAQAAHLSPGRALDVGCGEGADAVWLAQRGWEVTAIDISAVALGRAAQAATRLGHQTAQRITWRQVDLAHWDAPTGAYDLVNAQYLHLPSPLRQRVWAQLAGAVAAGGSLLIVAHDLDDHSAGDHSAGEHRLHQPELFFSAAELIAEVGDGWITTTNVVVDRPREAAGAHVKDLVVCLTRPGLSRDLTHL